MHSDRRRGGSRSGSAASGYPVESLHPQKKSNTLASRVEFTVLCNQALDKRQDIIARKWASANGCPEVRAFHHRSPANGRAPALWCRDRIVGSGRTVGTGSFFSCMRRRFPLKQNLLWTVGSWTPPQRRQPWHSIGLRRETPLRRPVPALFVTGRHPLRYESGIA